MRIRSVSLLSLTIGVCLSFNVFVLSLAEAEAIDKCLEAYKQQNYAVSSRCFKALAEQGNPSAQSWLGIHYADGKGVPQSHQDAVKWLMKAADQKYADAQFLMGGLYLKGQGVKQDNQEAVQWFRKAAEQGHRSSQNSLGNMYRDGKGIKQNFSEAAQWYKKAAEQGLASAQSELGFFYIAGKGVPQDYDEAARWFRKAADAGFAVAQINMAHCYEFGKGVPLDYDEAVKWLNKASAQGNSDAKNKLASFDRYKDKLKAPRLTDSEYLSLGRIAEEKYKDCDTALNSYLEVSEQGRKDPEWSLSAARSFECVKNYKEAVYYYRKYDAMKPRQTKISIKLQELQTLLAKEQQGNVQNQKTTEQHVQKDTKQIESCIGKCLQVRRQCGTSEKCQKAFNICSAACRDSDPWKTLPAGAAPVNVSEIRHFTSGEYTRVEVRLSDKIDFTRARILNPDRLFFDLKNTKIQKDLQKTIKVDDDMLISIRAGQFNDSTVRVVLDLREGTDFKVTTADNPLSILIDIYRTALAPKSK